MCVFIYGDATFAVFIDESLSKSLYSVRIYTDIED